MRFAALFAFALVTLACTPKSDETPRAQLTALLTDSIGASLHPTASYLKDSTHLEIDLDSAAFASPNEADREMKARRIAELSLRHYSRRAELDSVTVQSRALVRPGVARIIWSRTYSASEVTRPQ